MLPEQQQRIMGYFIEEAKDHLNTIEQGLLNLQATIEDSEMANEVFRAAHSVKGGAAMLGIDSIQRTSHRLEDYFKVLKESPVRVDRTLESMFLQVFDALSEQLENLQGPFGLTDEKAQEIMGAVEPVFDQISNHLNHLVANSDAAPAPAAAPAAAPARAATPAKAARTEESALQLVFKSDVPGQLREMLALLKQPDSESSRQALKERCSTLARQGEQFDLAAWCDLLKTAELAIANPDNTYRTLAPVLIKEIKHAQELVLGGRESEIAASQTLQDLLPDDVLDFALEGADLDLDQSFDNLLDDALSQPADPDPDFSDLFSSPEGTSDSIPELAGEETDWLGLDQPTDDGELDFGDLDAPVDGAAADDLDQSTADGDLDLGDLDLDDLDAGDLDAGGSDAGDLEEDLDLDVLQTADEYEADESESVDLEAGLNFDQPDQSDGWDGLDLPEGDADSFAADLGAASDESLGDLSDLDSDLDLEDSDFGDSSLEDSDFGDGDLDNALDSDFDDLAAAAPETPRQGPEVGLAELNSLADLFEGDSDMPGNTWQEEVVGPEVPMPEHAASDSDDFSDLLGDAPDESTSSEADLGDLFGDELSEEAAPDDGLGGFDFDESPADANLDDLDDDLDLPSEQMASVEADLAVSEVADAPDLAADLFTDPAVIPEDAVPEDSAPEDAVPEDSAPEDLALDDSVLDDSIFEADEDEAEADLFSDELDMTEAESAEAVVPDSSLALDIDDSGEDEFADLLSVGGPTPPDGAQSEVDAFFDDGLTDTEDDLTGGSSLEDAQNLGDLDDIFGDAGEDTTASLSFDADPAAAIATEETDATWNPGDDLAVASAATPPTVEDSNGDADDSTSASDLEDWDDIDGGTDAGIDFDTADDLDLDADLEVSVDADSVDDDIDADLWDSTALSADPTEDALDLDDASGAAEDEAEAADLADLDLFDSADDAAVSTAAEPEQADADWSLGGELDGEETGDEAGFGDWLDASASGGELETDVEIASLEANPTESDLALEDFDFPAEDSAEDLTADSAEDEDFGFDDESLTLDLDAGLSGEAGLETQLDGTDEEGLEDELGEDFGGLFDAADDLETDGLETDDLEEAVPEFGGEATDLASESESPAADAELDDLFAAEDELPQTEDEGSDTALSDLDLALESDESGELDDLWGEEAAATPDLDLTDAPDLAFGEAGAEAPTAPEQSSDWEGLDEPLDEPLDDDFDGLDDLLMADDPPAAVDAGPADAGLGLDLTPDSAAAELTAASGTDDELDDLDSLLDDDSALAAIAPEPDSSEPDSPAAAELEDSFDDDDSFDDLDALLNEGEADDSGAIPADMSLDDEDEDDEVDDDEEDEFGDLEKLLEEADQALGGTGKGLMRTAQPSLRRARSGGVLGDQTMKVSVKHLDNLSNLVGELVVNRNTLEQDQERLRQFHDNLLFQVQQLNDVGQRMRDLYERSLLESSLMNSRQAYQLIGPSDGSPAKTSHASGAVFDDLEMDRFTGFHTLSQEMIELIVRVRESASDIAYTVESSDQVTRQFRQVTTQLQEGLNKARMMPFSQTADRLPRAVRDISLKCGKEARLVVEGRDTLIDRMILDKLYDPMTHLVNNAIAHGIESPEVRAAAGKPVEGSIIVRAFYQGNQTVIYVADDGAGINPAVVKRKAIQKGLITPAQGDQMSDIEIIDLLFQPGFSTRDQADDISGRGVGMDVVRTELEKIRGVVSIDTTLGKGTSFTIRLPLTLSISKALTCISNQARIAFPMDGVEDMFDVPRDRVQQNDQGQSSILWRDTLLPFRPLSDLLQFNRSLGRGRVYGGNQDDEVISIVMLRSANTHIALQVDQVLGEQEIVIKQLEGPVPKPVGIAGATVLGDGRVMPIADVLELIDLSLGRVRREAGSSLWASDTQTPAAETQPVQTEPMVLIVDDSITVRELLSMSFNKVGYRVEQARDGQEAWEKLRSGLPCDLVFCDIEMPRMDGLELLSRIQKDPNLTGIPIAMLTSRGADRHRQMAVDLGASGYFTKPYLEEALLDAAQRMLNGERMAGIKIATADPAE